MVLQWKVQGVSRLEAKTIEYGRICDKVYIFVMICLVYTWQEGQGSTIY